MGKKDIKAVASSEDPAGDAVVEKSQYKKKKERTDLELPEGVDPWKEQGVSREEMPRRVLYEESSFSTLFPKYREKYIKEIWPLVVKELDGHGIACKLDLIEGSMFVNTTKKCWDPVAILKARDLMRLLSRSVPFHQAVKIMLDENNCDIIKIGGFVRSKERFIKRRQRLIGPDGATLKSIELLTKCYVLIQGTTVSCIGPWSGLLQVRKIIEDCMKNIHPIYNIKELMIKDDTLKDESWERFLPKFKKTNNSKKKKAEKKAKNRDASAISQEQMPRKVDLQMASGEYFLTDAKKEAKKKQEREEKQTEAITKKQEKRNASLVAPVEKDRSSTQNATNAPSTEETLKKIQSSLQSAKRKGPESSLSAEDFIQTKKNKSK
eukprot:gene15625-18565_t